MAKHKFPDIQSHDKPVLIIELEKEIASLKGRLDLVEGAIKELWECYKDKHERT